MIESDLLPLVIYDDMCYLCSKFASVVRVLSRNTIPIIGHYSENGMKVKSEIFDKNYDSTKMFWFITKDNAYGGRAAILPLIWNILTNTRDRPIARSAPPTCGQECKTAKTFFARTTSLLCNSEKIALRPGS
jgi:predicted DCC family thiol-disulfide oxidoreductase YuxK